MGDGLVRHRSPVWAWDCDRDRNRHVISHHMHVSHHAWRDKSTSELSQPSIMCTIMHGATIYFRVVAAINHVSHHAWRDKLLPVVAAINHVYNHAWRDNLRRVVAKAIMITAIHAVWDWDWDWDWDRHRHLSSHHFTSHRITSHHITPTCSGTCSHHDAWRDNLV